MTSDLIDDRMTIIDRIDWLLLKVIISIVPYTTYLRINWCFRKVETFRKSSEIFCFSNRAQKHDWRFLLSSFPLTLIQPSFGETKAEKLNLIQTVNPLKKRYGRENSGHYLPAN